MPNDHTTAWRTFVDQQGAVRDGESIGSYGDWSQEVLAWRGVVLVDESPRSRWLANGSDAAAFLARLVTYSVDKLAPGQGCRPFLLDAKGRIQVAFRCYRTAVDAFKIECAEGWGEVLGAKLDMYHFGEDFSLACDARGALGIGGQDAAACLQSLGVDVPEDDWGHIPASVADRDCHIFRDPRYGHPYFSMWASYDDLPAIWAALRVAGAVPSGHRANEAVRIGSGQPSAPNEFSDHYTPLDVAALDGITDGKGCYPGQEVIERTIAIGRPANQLVAVESTAALGSGMALFRDEKGAGSITSAAQRPDGRWSGLAAVKSRHSAAAEWYLDDGATVHRSQTDPPGAVDGSS